MAGLHKWPGCAAFRLGSWLRAVSAAAGARPRPGPERVVAAKNFFPPRAPDIRRSLAASPNAPALRHRRPSRDLERAAAQSTRRWAERRTTTSLVAALGLTSHCAGEGAPARAG